MKTASKYSAWRTLDDGAAEPVLGRESRIEMRVYPARAGNPNLADDAPASVGGESQGMYYVSDMDAEEVIGLIAIPAVPLAVWVAVEQVPTWAALALLGGAFAVWGVISGIKLIAQFIPR